MSGGWGCPLDRLFTASFAGYMCFLGFSALGSGSIFTWFRAVFIMVLNDFLMVFLHFFRGGFPGVCSVRVVWKVVMSGFWGR